MRSAKDRLAEIALVRYVSGGLLDILPPAKFADDNITPTRFEEDKSAPSREREVKKGKNVEEKRRL